MPQTTGGWDVHTHIVPPAVVAAGGRGAFGMRASSDTLTICAHGVPLHPITEVNKLADRVKSDHLDGAIVSVPPPLFRPDLNEADCRDYAKLVNEGLFEACRDHAGVLRPLAYLPVEAPEVAASIAASLDGRWELTQKFLYNKKLPQLQIDMSLRNLGPTVTDVRLARIVDWDNDNTVGGDNQFLLERGTAANGDGGHTTTLTNVTFTQPADRAIAGFGPACSPARR